MKKPFLAWLVQIALALIALIYGASAVFSLAVGVGLWFILAPALIGFLIAGGFALCAGRLLWQATRQTANGRTVVIFFWAVLFIYPLTNVLSSMTLYPPKLQIAPEQMMGAAIAEAARYLLLLVLIVWLSFSKGTRAWLGAQRRPPSLFAFGAPADNPDSTN